MHAFASTDPLKIKSILCGGVPVVMVPLIVFSDDSCGNKSKFWNKFDSYCIWLATHNYTTFTLYAHQIRHRSSEESAASKKKVGQSHLIT